MPKQEILNAAEFVAGLMMGHFENPMASPHEFMDDDVPNKDEIENTINASVGSDMYGPGTLELRQEILKQLRIQLKV